MEWKIVHIDETDTTNRWLREHGGSGDMVVWADFQTAGRGCGANTWESARGANLLFSVLVHPDGVAAGAQFSISMAAAVALCEVLDGLADGFSVKWPNDIYWRDSKVSGMLIETRVQGGLLRDCIIGIGVNVNQRVFVSDAPNPVSICQITGRELDREQLLRAFLAAFGSAWRREGLAEDYAGRLYRRGEWAEYADEAGRFTARLEGVEADGRLVLTDEAGGRRRYAFKEVRFVI